MEEADLQNIQIPAKDGYLLSATLRFPDGVSKGVVQIQGGVGISQERYTPFAEYLRSNGYTTLTFDYRGIGASKPDHLKGFEASIMDWGQKDMTGIFDWVLENYPNQKKIFIGHSIGGQVIGLMENSEKIDQIFFISCSTGYWKDMSGPAKYAVPLAWYFYVPLVVPILGYANSKRLRWGEDLPKGVVMQWRKWCTHPNYLGSDVEDEIQEHFFDRIKVPLKSIYMSDDPVANDVTVPKILSFYPNAKVSVEKINPKDVGRKKLGHSGFFAPESEAILWPKLLAELVQS